MKRFWNTVVTLVAATGCTDLSNSGARALELHDLSAYALTETDPVLDVAYFLASEQAPRLLGPGADVTVAVADGFWTMRVARSTDSLTELRKVSLTGEVVETRSYGAADFGYATEFGGAAYAHDLEPAEDGNLWILWGFDSWSEAVLFDPLTGEILQRRAGLPPANYEQVLLAYDDGLLFTLTRDNEMVAVDTATGAVVFDYTDGLREILGGQSVSAPLAVAVHDGVIAYVGSDGDSDLLLLDVLTGAPLGHGGGVGMRSLSSHSGGFVALDEMGLIARFDLVAVATSSIDVGAALALEDENARAVAYAEGEFWILYQREDEAVIVGYDPETRAALEGFALPSSVGRDLSGGEDEETAYAMTASGGTLYIVAASSFDPEFGAPRLTRVHLIDLASGERQGTYAIPAVRATGACAVDDTLWLVETTELSAATDWQEWTPFSSQQLRAVELGNGLNIPGGTLTLDSEGRGTAKLHCGSDSVFVSTVETRLWVELDPSSGDVLGYKSLRLPSAGADSASGAEVWMLDRQRDLVLTTEGF
jgi:hypothetical protein